MQVAANDLVNAEEEAMGEEHVGERREGDGVGEEGGAALMDEDLPGVKAEEGVGEEPGGACMEEHLPDGGPGIKQGRVLETVFRELSSADMGVGEDTEAILNGEEQGGAWTKEEGGRALTGEEERCLRLGLKAEGTLLGSVSWPGVVIAGPSTRLEISKEGLEDGRLPDGRLGLARPMRVREPCWSGSLEAKE